MPHSTKQWKIYHQNLQTSCRDNVLSGTVSGSIETAVDDMLQNIIKGTAAAGIGASLAGVEANAAQREQGQAQESRIIPRRRRKQFTKRRPKLQNCL